jgi:pimeloyl-ACP methyl ester carboxylesterase
MTRLHHRLDGPGDAPVLVLGPSIGTTMDLWEPQLPALTAAWRVLRYDLPGHGGSEVLHGTIGDIADAVAATLDALGLDTVAYGGVSLGGAIGTTLAIEHPARITSLILCSRRHARRTVVHARPHRHARRAGDALPGGSGRVRRVL